MEFCYSTRSFTLRLLCGGGFRLLKFRTGTSRWTCGGSLIIELFNEGILIVLGARLAVTQEMASSFRLGQWIEIHRHFAFVSGVGTALYP